MRSEPTSDRPLIGWLALLGSICLVGGSIFVLAFNGTDDTDLEEDAAAIELLDVRRDLELSSLQLVALRMLDAVELDGDRRGSLEDASERVTNATARAEALLESDGSTALEVAALFDDMFEEPYADPLNADLSELFYNGEFAARNVGRAEVVSSRLDSIHQLSFVGTLPVHTLIEGIAADAAVNERPIDSGASDFFEMISDIVLTDGGWYGADPTAPFDDSEWIELDGAREQLPIESATLADITAASPVIEQDAWMAGLVDGLDQPPYDLASFVDLVDALETDLAEELDPLYEEQRAAIATARSDLDADRTRNLTIVAVLLLVAFATFVFGVSRVIGSIRSSKAIADMASRDALTGAGNRHALDDRVRKLLRDKRFTEHVVVMIDLDRFKMVNDTYGHAAGDAVLVEVARGLDEIGSSFVDSQPGTEHSVVRLGGDEFQLTVHRNGPIDITDVHRRLDFLRKGSVDFDGDRLSLGFSIGLAESSGPSNLDDLMQATDLAVYDDKSARRAARQTPNDIAPPSPSAFNASQD